MHKKNNKFDIVMFWYQNDSGIYGRRNEMIAETLLRHPQINRVLHIEPPITGSFLGRLFLRTLHSPKGQYKFILQQAIRRLSGRYLHHQERFLRFTPPGLFFDTSYERLFYKINKFIAIQMIDKIIKSYSFNDIILWLSPPHPFCKVLIEKIKSKLVCCDCVDDCSRLVPESQREAILQNYKFLLNRADIVFTASKKMYENMKRFNPHIYCIPNAVEPAHFRPDLPSPSDLRRLKSPRIGYTGYLSERIDEEILKFIAHKNPDWNIILIGNIMPSSQNIFRLKKIKNIHFLGVRSYAEIPKYISNFDVCIIPHKINNLTEYMDPLKLYAYLSAGKPVVSTDIAGLNGVRDIISIAKNKEEFNLYIGKYLTANTNGHFQEARKRMQQHTWEKRVELIMELINCTFKIKKNNNYE